MRRVALGAIAIAVAVVAVWKLRGSSEAPAVSAGAAGTPMTIVRGERRPDPKTMMRGSIAGSVTAEGPTLGGAQVCVRGSSPHLADEVLRDPTCTKTDANGRYKLAGLLP